VVPQFTGSKDKMDSSKALEHDVVGFGLVLLHMLTCRCTDLPSEIYDAQNYLDRSKRDREKIDDKLEESLERISNVDLKALIRECLDKTTKTTVEELLKNKFFTDPVEDKLITDIVEVAKKNKEEEFGPLIEDDEDDVSSDDDEGALAYIQGLPEY